MQETAVVGDMLSITYRIENHGGKASGRFSVDFLLSTDSHFGPGDAPLTTRSIASLGAGKAFTETFTVALPETVPGSAFVGMWIDHGDKVSGELSETNNHSQRHGADWDTLRVLKLTQEAAGDNDSAARAQAVTPGTRIVGRLSLGDRDFYRFEITDGPGRLIADVHAATGDTRLTLLGSDQTLLIQSAAQPGGRLDDRIVQHLQPGTYYLMVESAVSDAVADYALSLQFDEASALSDRLPLDELLGGGRAMVAGDFNRDGHLDVISYGRGANVVATALGMGDGTFRPGPRTQLGGSGGAGEQRLVAGDFTRDDVLDLVVWVDGTAVELLVGMGDGSFQVSSVGRNPFGAGFGLGTGNFDAEVNALASGDWNGDGLLDLVATVNVRPTDSKTGDMDYGQGAKDGISTPPQKAGLVFVAFARGNGVFDVPEPFRIDGTVNQGLHVCDLNGDGLLDLVVGNRTEPGAAFLTVYHGRPGGAFVEDPAGSYAARENAFCIVSGDFNRDGRLDLIAADELNLPGRGTIWYGTRGGSLTPAQPFGERLSDLGVADLNQDGVLDLLTNRTALLGLPQGGLQPLGFDYLQSYFPEMAVRLRAHVHGGRGLGRRRHAGHPGHFRAIREFRLHPRGWRGCVPRQRNQLHECGRHTWSDSLTARRLFCHAESRGRGAHPHHAEP
ncbi:MAG: VCBS repeat-containing protein [Planctomycetia bacterium]|nr:VCBS repeat-containing protein [Planctomycetia bacterium]